MGESGSTSELVESTNFLCAMRDAGYNSPAAALAELVDNAIEADARNIDIRVSMESGKPATIEVHDDGCGMTPKTLSRALRFGGSSRFGSRSALGRFGMGLPTASLSLAPQVEVETWRSNTVHLAALRSKGPNPVTENSRRVRSGERTPTGTVVRLLGCDRIGYHSRGRLARALRLEFGRTYRRLIAAGHSISVDGEPIAAIEHLCGAPGCRPFGDALKYRLPLDRAEHEVVVRFAELPVAAWATLSDAEKRKLGVSPAAPVSVLRAGREIDRGWHFMGDKPKENYDAWWRCEIDFEPTLDEEFGVTFTKQGIRPTSELRALLSADLEPIARTLNKRVRNAFELLRIEEPRQAAERDLREALQRTTGGRWKRNVGLSFERLPSGDCVEVTPSPHRSDIELVVNVDHPAVRHLYRPLAESNVVIDRKKARFAIAALLAQPLTSLVTSGGYQVDWEDMIAALMENVV